ncbi:hypothetical protein SGPA1_20781 [Streptomyces misionensis JCM 4497]
MVLKAGSADLWHPSSTEGRPGVRAHLSVDLEAMTLLKVLDGRTRVGAELPVGAARTDVISASLQDALHLTHATEPVAVLREHGCLQPADQA